MHPFLKDTDGFTLVEMAIVLAIIGIIAGLSLPLMTHYKDQERKQITLKHQEIVLTVLGIYAARHHQLPCPSDQLLGNNSGMARLSCNDKTQTKAFGFIPFRTLGIPESKTKDAYGHPMYYAVNPSLTDKDSYCISQSTDYTFKSLTVFDETGQPVMDPQENVPLAVVIVSEGEAYKKPVSSQEVENVTPNLQFYAHPYSQNPNQPFRQFILWASRDMLIRYYGNSTCTKADLRLDTQPRPSRDIMNEPDPLFQ